MYDRDVNGIRLVGGLCVGIGLLLFLLTFVGSVYALFTNISANINAYIRGIAAAVTSLLMSVTLIACGGELQRLRFYGRVNLENLRLVWAALVLMMVIFIIAGAYLIPPLAGVAFLVLLLVFTIRGAVSRVTRY
jgi:hypothetical protein